MKIHLFTLLLSFAGTLAFAQDCCKNSGSFQVQLDTNQTTGIVTKNCIYKRLPCYKAEYKNDRLHGKEIKWYHDREKGAIKVFERAYVNGVLHGPFLRWREGVLMEEGNYVEGNKHGTVTEYYDSTSICRETQYKNGKIEIEYIWHRNGRRSKEKTVMDSTFTTYTENTWYENGEKRQEKKIEQEVVRIWNQWDATGKQEIKNGKGKVLIKGRSTPRFPEGVPDQIEIYKDGLVVERKEKK